MWSLHLAVSWLAASCSGGPRVRCDSGVRCSRLPLDVAKGDGAVGHAAEQVVREDVESRAQEMGSVLHSTAEQVRLHLKFVRHPCPLAGLLPDQAIGRYLAALLELSH